MTRAFSCHDLIELLILEPVERDLFRAQHGPGTHVFGGQVMAQAMIAAAQTVDTLRLHSIHAYFLRAGDSTRPILFEVDRIRDGRSFCTRRVVGIQSGRAIFSLSASFQSPEDGFSHQFEMPDVAAPEQLSQDLDHYRRLARTDPRFQRFLFRFGVIDSRQVEGIQMFPRDGRDPLPPRKNTWMRLKGRPEESPVEIGGRTLATEHVHAALLAYLSDMDFLAVALLPHGPALERDDVQVASLDHTMWFHRPFRVDEWLLFAKESISASGSRGTVRGQFFDQEGNLVASTMQECLMRLRPKAERAS